MTMTASQKGTAGEQLFAACVTLTSNGDLELFKPLVDDDHTDVTAGRRGAVPVLAIQVKTALTLDRKGLAVARMSFPSGEPREHPSFVYFVLYVAGAAVECGWRVPSADFNRLAYKGAGPGGRGLELEFMASPVREDRWSGFRCSRLEIGPRLLELVGQLPAAKPPRFPGTHLLLRRGS